MEKTNNAEMNNEAMAEELLDKRRKRYIFKDKPAKQKVTSVLSIGINNTFSKDRIRRIKTGANMLLELLGLKTIEELKEIEYFAPDGKKMTISGMRKFFAHDDTTGIPDIVYMDLPTFVPWGRDKALNPLVCELGKLTGTWRVKDEAEDTVADMLEERSCSAIMDGVRVLFGEQVKVWTKFDETLFDIPKEELDNAVIYEYSFSAAAKLRSVKGGIFARTTISHNESEIEKFGKFIPFLEELHGADVILNRVTGFEWSRQFKGKVLNASKVVTRAGLSLSNSVKVKIIPRIYMLGEIKTKFTPEVERMLKEVWGDKAIEQIKEKLDADGNVVMSSLFKEAKWDGMGVCRASFAHKILGSMGYNMKDKDPHELIGKAFMHRALPGTKGLLAIVGDEEFDKRIGPDGSHIYKDYDIIFESNSVKYIADLETIKPEHIHLIRFSNTKKYSKYMNYMYWLGLDQGFNEPKNVINKVVNQFKNALSDPAQAKALLNMVDDNMAAEELGVDAYQSNLNTTLAKIIDADEHAIHDPIVRNSMISSFSNMFKQMGYGRIPIEGACRFIITDPTGFFLTHKMVPALDKDGNQKTGYNDQPLYDIIIDDPNELALRRPDEVYWNNKECDALLMRSPMTHPGQVPKVRCVNKIPDVIPTPDGGIETKYLFDTTGKKGDLIILNAFGLILEMMGGADDDGDMILIITESAIIRMRSPRRSFCIPEDAAGKAVEEEMSTTAIKKFFMKSLMLNMVGILTNHGVAWRDLELHVLNMQYGEELPFKVLKGLAQAGYKAHQTLLGQSMSGFKPQDYTKNELEQIKYIAALHTKYATKPRVDMSTYKMNKMTPHQFNAMKTDIIMACEAACAILASLQMIEIDSAKTQKNVDTNKYLFLSNKHTYVSDFTSMTRSKCGWQPDWHKRMQNAKYGKVEDKSSTEVLDETFPGMEAYYPVEKESNDITYKSKSIMGVIKDYIEKEYESFVDYAHSSSTYKIYPEWSGAKSHTQAVNTIKRYFANDMQDTITIEDESHRMIERRQIMDQYNLILRDYAIANNLSNEEMTSIIYTCSNMKTKNFFMRGFLLYCWSSEFILALHVNRKKFRSSIVHATLLPEFIHYDIVDGMYQVKEKGIYHPDGYVIGNVNLADGEYRGFSVSGHAFMETNVETIEKKPQSGTVFHDAALHLICTKDRAEVINDIKSLSCIVAFGSGVNKESGREVTIVYAAHNKMMVPVAELAKFMVVPSIHKKYFKVSIDKKLVGTKSISLVIDKEVPREAVNELINS